jgi:hypothetical protein
LGTTPLLAAGLPRFSRWSLEHRPWLVPLILLLMPLVGHLPSVILGLSSNPIWTQSGAVVGVGHQLVAGWAFGDPNVGWTNQALGHLAAQDWLHGRIPWWNPYSGIGLPLAGEMQPAAMFLPFVLLLGFQGGIVWLELVLQVFAGFMTFYFLRRIALGRASALVGALLFEFNGTFAAVPGETILNVLPFLPMLLLGIEYAREIDGGRRAIIVIALAIGGSLLAGFPEAAYIDGLLGLLWAIARFLRDAQRLRFVIRVGLGGVFGLMLAAPQLVAFADFAALTNIFEYHTLGGITLTGRAAAAVVIPYIYGPLNTNFGNSLLVSISGGNGGYVGAAGIIFAVMGGAIKRDRAITVVLVLWLVLSAGKTFGIPPIMDAMNMLPFMKDTEFFRYSSPAWELAAIVLIARALDQSGRAYTSYRIALAVVTLFIIMSIALAWPWASVWHWSAENRAIMARWLGRAVGFQIGTIVVISVVWLRAGVAMRRAFVGTILVAYSMAMFVVPQLSGVRAGRVDIPAIKYLKTHAGLNRFYTVGPIQPNYSAYFSIPNINHNYLPVSLKWTDYIEKSLFPSAATQNGSIFWAPFPPMQVTTAVNNVHQYIKNYQFLGVRYIVTNPGVQINSTISLPENDGPRVPFRLDAQQSLTLNRVAPKIFLKLNPISKIGILQGNYENTATGNLAVSLCAHHKCSSGRANLAKSADNSAFYINITPPITIGPGEHFRVTVSHTDGNHPDAIWLLTKAISNQSVTTPSGETLVGRNFQLVFSTGINAGQFNRVYSDRLMDIWRVRGADDFYTTQGSKCVLQNSHVDRVTAICDGMADLVRRELFMPGWHAEINSSSAKISVDHGIVQKISLHRGLNTVKFYFAPPYSTYAWILFWISALILGWQILGGRLPRGRQFVL